MVYSMQMLRFPVLLLFSILANFAIFVNAQSEIDPIERLYSSILNFVDEKGMVDYSSLKRNRKLLDSFETSMDRLEPSTYRSWQEEQKIAFWMNAYNAFTLKAIIDHYPIEASFFSSILYPKNSIRQIAGVWNSLPFRIMGRSYTLDEIEHEILRKQFDEPRLHMALVCAAKGCPALRNEPYTAAGLSQQLDDQARIFLENSKNFRIEKAESTVYLSKIFDWYGLDFLGKFGDSAGFKGKSHVQKAVLAFISQYLPEEDSSYLREEIYTIRFLEYDWTLNEQ